MYIQVGKEGFANDVWLFVRKELYIIYYIFFKGVTDGVRWVQSHHLREEGSSF